MRIDADQAAAGTPVPGVAPVDPELLAAAKAFEQQLLGLLARELERSASLLGESDDGEAGTPGLDGLLSDALAQSLADAGGIGLAAELARAAGRTE